jgi:hypothetical protein
MILESVSMETATVEAEPSAPATGVTEGTAPELGTAVALDVRVEAHVDSLPGANTDIVVQDLEIEEAAPIRSTPMSKATSTSRGGLELLDDNLIDPIVIARSMESMRRTEQWIKIRCGYPE